MPKKLAKFNALMLEALDFSLEMQGDTCQQCAHPIKRDRAVLHHDADGDFHGALCGTCWTIQMTIEGRSNDPHAMPLMLGPEGEMVLVCAHCVALECVCWDCLSPAPA